MLDNTSVNLYNGVRIMFDKLNNINSYSFYVILLVNLLHIICEFHNNIFALFFSGNTLIVSGLIIVLSGLLKESIKQHKSDFSDVMIYFSIFNMLLLLSFINAKYCVAHIFN